MDQGDAPKETCFCCGRTFSYGNHEYHGQWVKTYRIMVCSVCYKANHDGWGLAYESLLLEHLVQSGAPVPARNAKGWLPRD